MLVGVKHTRAYQAIAVLAIVGFSVSLYSTYIHFTNTASFCNFSAKFNCDVVNRGAYSEIFGIPIALLGVIGYALMFLVAYEMIIHPRRKMKLLFAAKTAFAVGFSAHLAWISGVLLNTWCVSCIASYVIILAILALFLLAEV